MKLYNYFRSSASYRVRIALEIKGLKYEYAPIHLINNGGEQNSSFYAEMNPMKQVPTLVDNGFSLTQSLVIIEYLDETYPEIKLFPYSIQDRMRVKEFCEIVNSGIQPLQNLKTAQTLESMFGATTTQKENWFFYWLEHGYHAMEYFMKKYSKSYTYGNTLTAADCFLVPQMFAAKRLGFKVDRYPNVCRVADYVMNHPLVLQAHPEKQPDYKP